MLPRRIALLAWIGLIGFCAGNGVEEPEPTADEDLLRSAKLPTDGEGLLAFFRSRTPDDDTRAQLAVLISRLGSESFSLRQEASKKLNSSGPNAIALLRAAELHADLEIRWRARQALYEVRQRDVPEELQAAALRVLGRLKPARTAEVLLAYAPHAHDSDLADELERVLSAAAVCGGKADPVLVRGLSDKDAVKRGVAAVALLQAGSRVQGPSIRRLLRDPDRRVRQRVALALLETREKEAIPVLIALLTESPREEAERVEAMLLQVAGDDAPTGNLDEDQTKYRDAWTAWWTSHGEGLDLRRLDLSQRWLGYTLAICFAGNPRTGCVLELDARGKIRWQIPGVRCPVDAQILDERRVLVTEYGNGLVTERNHQGEILRRISVPDFPLEARRLANGNTLITTRSRVFEVDRDDKEVWTTPRDRTNTMYVASCSLRGGEIGVCTRNGEFIRMNREGKVLATFHVGRLFRPYGTHLQVLSNGHVLVPLYYENEIAEFDLDGNKIWSLEYPRPMTAQRLPNGRTLVSSYGANEIVELDRKGNEVKNKHCDGRLMCVRAR